MEKKNRNFSENVSPIGMQRDIQDPEPGECRKHCKFISVINHRQEHRTPVADGDSVFQARTFPPFCDFALLCLCGETGGSRE